MWDNIIAFLTAAPLWELLIIIISRIVEVSMGTIRIILINKGYRLPSVILAFFEVMIWVFVASGVIGDIAEKPIKGIVYSIGFASGVYAGSRLEAKLAVGKVLIQVITTQDQGNVIAEVLRDLGYGVTAMKGRGKDTDRAVLLIYANRKGNGAIIDKIHEIDEHAMIVSNDVSSLRGGYISAWRRFVK